MKRLALLTRLTPLVASLLFLSSCASAQLRHNLVVASAAVAEALTLVHSTEQTALCGAQSCAGNAKVENVPGWTKSKSEAFNTALLPAVSAGREFNETLAAWDPSKPMPTQLANLVASISASLSRVLMDFPAGSVRESLLSYIAKIQSLVLGGITLVLSVKG